MPQGKSRVGHRDFCTQPGLRQMVQEFKADQEKLLRCDDTIGDDEHYHIGVTDLVFARVQIGAVVTAQSAVENGIGC